MPKLTPGIKKFKANIREMKKLGVANDRARAREAKQNTKSHLQMMADRAAAAAADAERRRLAGIASRDAHNARLAAEKAERAANQNNVKLVTSRAA